jgi:Na+/H+ antiporter NhaD/arsenite permease-like protein
MTEVLVVAAFAGAYVLNATERVHRVAAALGGAAAMVLLGVVDAEVAFFSEETGVDWNVIFLLLGMMIIVSVLKQTGVFALSSVEQCRDAVGRAESMGFAEVVVHWPRPEGVYAGDEAVLEQVAADVLPDLHVGA